MVKQIHERRFCLQNNYTVFDQIWHRVYATMSAGRKGICPVGQELVLTGVDLDELEHIGEDYARQCQNCS